MQAPPVMAAPKKRRPSMWIIVVISVMAIGGCVFIPIIAAILFPVFSQARMAAKRTADLGEVKASAVALLAYTADNDNRYPPDAAAGLNAARICVDTETQMMTADQNPLVMNSSLVGANVNEIWSPQMLATVCVISCPPVELESNSYTVIGFADTHAKVFRAPLAETMAGIEWSIPEPEPE
jgi:hypothetical protein